MRPAAWLCAALCSLAVALPAAAQSTPEAQLLAAEDARFRATLAHDAAALDRATADDLVYSHGNGLREDKAAALRTAMRLNFSAITPSERTARVLGDVGIVRGKVVRQLPDRTLTDGYLAVYTKRDGRWQLLEWVSANPPPAPAKEQGQ